MSTDRAFRFTWVPNRYADRLVRAAVLYPLTKRCRSPRQIVEQTEQLIAQWRARLHALQAYNWTPRYSEHGLTFARNCLPTFAYATPRTRPCGNAGICPFCYARWVRDVWETVDAAFPNDRDDCDQQLSATDDTPVEEGADGPLTYDDRELRPVMLDAPTERQFPYHLLTYYSQRRYGYLPEGESYDAREAYLRQLLEEATAGRYRRFRRRGAHGAFANLTVEPHRRGWVFRLRELYMVERDFPTPEARLGKFHRHPAPTRSVLLQALMRVCRYPPRLLRGDPEWTAVFLRARQGIGLSKPSIRMTGMYGRFRNRRSNDGISVHDRHDPS